MFLPARQEYPCEANSNVPDTTTKSTVSQQKMLFMQDQMRKLSQPQGIMERKKQNDEAKHELRLGDWSSLDESPLDGEKQKNETGFQEAAQQTSNEYA